ncbi:chitinase [Vibrio maritimus]|uniref:Chitinase n=1 Tax=Vibrio maritimus TaxID=990268 RepID=A0A090SZB8_9VIBR|nr:chitinase [Vibrio maritimus]
MKKAQYLALAAALGVSLPSAFANDKVVAGYFADWQYQDQRNPYKVQDIPADQLTHVIYAFLSMCGPHTAASAAVQQQIAKACEGKKPYTAVIVDQASALEVDFGDVDVEVNYQGTLLSSPNLNRVTQN